MILLPELLTLYLVVQLHLLVIISRALSYIYGKAGHYNPSISSFTCLWLQPCRPKEKSCGSFLPCLPLRQSDVKSWVFRAQRLCLCPETVLLWGSCSTEGGGRTGLLQLRDYFLLHQMPVLRDLLRWEAAQYSRSFPEKASWLLLMVYHLHHRFLFASFQYVRRDNIGENHGCQHTQRTCKPCLVENIFGLRTVIWHDYCHPGRDQ